MQDDKGMASCSFRAPLRSAGATQPVLMRLKAEDAARLGGVPLRGGKFDWTTELGHPESWVVASCGAYSVVWNFRCELFGSKVHKIAGVMTVPAKFCSAPYQVQARLCCIFGIQTEEVVF